ncbi:MAG: Mur ligase family protein [Clostridium sp.]
MILHRKLPQKAAGVDRGKEVTVPDEVTGSGGRQQVMLAQLSAAYFDHPAKELTTIGITGTKGKTTATYMVRSILEASGFKTGLIGTIETIIGDTVIPSVNTTPESYVVQESFRKMVDAGCKCVVMEVSSQALMLHRVSGFVFDYGIFTNLEPDHIGPNEHKDLADYIHCKSLCLSR